MSAPTPRQALQERVAAVILDGAARVLAERGDQASMSDVAAAAGVARATVYRYFPNRQALLDELAEVAATEAEALLAAARLDEVPPEEGVRRAVRALVEVGDPFVVLAREGAAGRGRFEERLAGRLARLFADAQASGAIRDDVPGSWLTEALVALVVRLVAARPARGREDTVATITSLFLDGARPPRPLHPVPSAGASA